MRKPQGFTLIELLIALGILGVVLGITFNGLMQTSRSQNQQEAVTNVQSKLRRTVEVITQDLRGAVLGGVINSPYTSNSSQISFALLNGAAGYPVTSAGTTSATVISTDPSLTNLGIANGDTLMLFDSTGNSSGGSTAGQAVIVQVNGTPTFTSSSSTWTVPYSSCSSASGAADVAFDIQTQGYRYSSTAKTLYMRIGSAAEVPVAYNITAFNLDYIYRDAATSAESVNPTGYNGGGNVAQRFTSGSNTLVLQRIQITLSAQESSVGQSITRTYTGQIEMINNVGNSGSGSTNINNFTGVMASC